MNKNTTKAGERQVSLSEFEARLTCRVSSRIARVVTQRNLASNKQINKTKFNNPLVCTMTIH